MYDKWNLFNLGKKNNNREMWSYLDLGESKEKVVQCLHDVGLYVIYIATNTYSKTEPTKIYSYMWDGVRLFHTFNENSNTYWNSVMNIW